MLQESPVFKGPRLPTSIHSTSDSIENGYTTLMRINIDHGSQEFGISDVRISDLRTRQDQDQSGPVRTRQDQSGGVRHGHSATLNIELCSSGDKAPAGALALVPGSILYLVLDPGVPGHGAPRVPHHAPPWVPYLCTTPGTPPSGYSRESGRYSMARE